MLRMCSVLVLVIGACTAGPAAQSTPPVTGLPGASSPAVGPQTSPTPSLITPADASQPREAVPVAAWRDLRQRFPNEVAVIRPTHLPSNLGPTVAYSYSSSANDWRYGVGYRGPSGVGVTFVLGLVNSGFAERQEPITVRGQRGLLLISSQFPQLQVTWTESDRRYYIQANGITTEEIRRIAAGLIDEP